MSKNAKTNVDKSWQTNSSSIDDETKRRMGEMWGAAQGAGNSGPSGLLTGAGQYGTAAQTAGNLGFGAMSGDPNAVSQLMNPYQQQVIDQNNAGWQKTNQQTMNAVNDAATKAGAFGGSRQGVATGVALANNNMAQQQQTAGLLQGGYSDAMNRAGQMAGMGFQGAQLNSNLGFGGVGNADQWKLAMMNQGYHGAMGGTSGSTNTGVGMQTEGGFSLPFFGGKR